MQEHSVDLDGVKFVFQTGKLAQMADGACLATYRDEVILATVGMSRNPREGMDFFPLMCDFQPKYYASGKVKGSRFIKREGRPSDSAVLNSRLIDRPLRPMFPKGMVNDVQVIANVLQTAATRSAGTMAITAASMAIQISGIPFEAPVAAVRVGLKDDGTFFLDPTYEEAEKGLLDLVVAGSEEAIMMVEAGANQLEDDKMVAALEYAHGYIKTLCKAQAEFAKKHTVTPLEPIFAKKDENAEAAVANFVNDAMLDEIRGVGKKALHAKVHAAEEKLLEHYKEQIENEELSKKGLLDFFNKAWSKRMRQNIIEKDIRADNRKSDDVRPLESEVGLLPRVHGTGLFQRGQTQILSAVTIGGPGDGQLIDDPDRAELTQMYIHHYNFPPFSVGDVKPLRGTNRREIGHGALAERALRYVMPTKEEGFPYFVRVVSEVLSCNGSSSMGSACGSTLALMDAGVPIKAPVSAVAMGLIIDDEGNYKILSDIQAAEDFCGDMDLKICGTEKGITALQMDIKLKGLKMELLVEALGKAQVARQTILDSMLAAIPEVRKEMSSFAPRITTVQIKTDDIRVIIGKGGETIQGLCKDFDVKIDIEDDGLIMISSTNGENARKTEDAIKALVYEPVVGDVFADAVVKKVTDFGAFVAFLPGKEALVHVSEMADERIENVEDFIKEGQKVNVKIIGKDRMGRLQLSMKQAT